VLPEYLLHRQQLKLTGKTTEPKANKPLKKFSKKRAKQQGQYRKLVSEMMEESNLCEMNTPVCTGIATGMQHKKRRGLNLLNKEYLIRSCDPCNLYCEQYPLYALEHGLAISVHKKEQ
jgi:hypothetical protein